LAHLARYTAANPNGNRVAVKDTAKAKGVVEPSARRVGASKVAKPRLGKLLPPETPMALGQLAAK
ncbi:MAG TPA: hypothetical protein VL498_01110, partial [Terracidiphilus sp.]|nr:hypothetical protein [Terracidiphilus sp.]